MLSQWASTFLLNPSLGLHYGHSFSNTNYIIFQTKSLLDKLDASPKEECEAECILGPFTDPPLPNFCTSGLGLVPKHDGGWCIIYHLSAPINDSINDFIDLEHYSLSYCTIDDTYNILNELGSGALMNKIDLKNAFQLIPVRAEDRNLLGTCWRQLFYIDTCLPFGLRSAPYLFNQLFIGFSNISKVYNISYTTLMISLPLGQQHHPHVPITYK